MACSSSSFYGRKFVFKKFILQFNSMNKILIILYFYEKYIFLFKIINSVLSLHDTLLKPMPSRTLFIMSLLMNPANLSGAVSLSVSLSILDAKPLMAFQNPPYFNHLKKCKDIYGTESENPRWRSYKNIMILISLPIQIWLTITFGTGIKLHNLM